MWTVPLSRLSYPTSPSDPALVLALAPPSSTDEGRPLTRAPEPALALAAAPRRRIVDDQTRSAVVGAEEVSAVAAVAGLQGATPTGVAALALGRARLCDE